MKQIGRGDSQAARLRASLGHPVIDADGHLIETPPVFMPFFEDFVRDIAGGDMVKRFRAVGGMDFDDMVLPAIVERAVVGRAAPGLGDTALLVVAAGGE